MKNHSKNTINNTENDRGSTVNSLTQERVTKSNAIDIPSISLPKGGGALKRIDEKFQVNAANGTASFSIPLPVSPGRNGFSPNLALSYNSGAGNSAFGLGWNVDLPKIQRRTDKGIPQYGSGSEEDIFQLSGAEDLVPLLDYANGDWIPTTVDNSEFLIHQYRPRIEGGFAKIERIERKVDSQVYWKVTTRDNTVQFFGLSVDSRLCDPEDSRKIYAWLPDFSHDDKGNWMQYEYKAEDLANVANSINERNRHNGIAAFTNRYLKRVKYGNRNSWYCNNPFKPNLPENSSEYFFEVVLDYGEHMDPLALDDIPTHKEVRAWQSRQDPFSSYRSGFEIRTYRKCHNILLFHHFRDEEQFIGTPDQENFGENYLVKSLSLDYESSSINDSGQTEVSYLKSIGQHGFIRKEDSYFKKSLPPLEFEYQRLNWNTQLKAVDRKNIANAPVGLTNNYQWVDLYGEGISGILSEQGGGWYYKSNLGDVDEDKQVRFTQAKEVAPKPSFMGLSSGVLSLQDLNADGQKQIVVNSPGVQGYFELSTKNEFDSFRPFENIANINLQDPNTRLLDLNGDGKPDIVMTEENVFSWYPSTGKKGHDGAKTTFKPYDDEIGPAIVFADQQQTIFLADMCGDGLTDIVRIRNGEICYWANKGYGKFSAKINMENAPLFDYPEQFNPKYLQLADISGTGASDIIYLGRNKFKAYINLTGNAWSNAHEIEPFFPIDTNAQVSVVDLLGTGTSCIVWSSDLPAESHSPLRYIDLMDSKKPHVLKKHVNNFGKETTLEYKSSTCFYIKDKIEGKPWITKLPFPVQVISKSIVEDKITDVRFTTEYAYHHGYYDHPDREFRGFGMVEQRDTEVYENWSANNEGNQLEQSEDLYQAPTLTKTWFHTGTFLDRERNLTQFKNEYWFEEYNKAFPDTPIAVTEPELTDAPVVANLTLEGLFDIEDLTVIEYREALRVCKGMMLRQEVFSLDAPLENPTLVERQKQLKPYTIATHNCKIQLLQPRDKNKHACFIVTESEAITINYERNEKDPRIAHTLNTKLDELGNVLEMASVVYPRVQSNMELPEEVREKQETTHTIYTSTSFTDDYIEDSVYRLRQPSEVKTFEITGLTKTNELYQIDDFNNILTTNSEIIAYDETPSGGTTQRRVIEHMRSLYYNEELTGALPMGKLGSHGISYESYQLAYTPDLLLALFGNKITDPDSLLSVEGKFVHSEGDDNWWIRSGQPLFINTDEGENMTSARNRFYVPIGYVSSFDNKTKVTYYEDYFLFLQSTEDAVGNQTMIDGYNFRTLSPIRMRDINNNISEVLLDELGMPKAMALLGKGEEADNLDGLTEFTPESERNAIQDYFTLSDTESLRAAAQNLLQEATSRFVYNFNRYQNSVSVLTEQLEENPEVELCGQPKLLPTVTGNIVREQHAQVNHYSPLQLSFEYSDGMGNVAMTKTQAESGKALNLKVQPNCDYTLETINTGDQLRWLGNGRTVLNNKGNPVKQYEPYFSVNPFYEDHKELVERGVTPIMYYDAVGRNIRSELPDGTFTKVEFDSWQQASFDQNDTVKESQWYDDRINNRIDAELIAAGKDPAKEKEAAKKAAKHYDTSSIVHLDTLGRPILSIAHNRIDEKDVNANVIDIRNEFYNTLIHLDIDGNAQKVIDARGNTVMEYGYDMLGHRVYQNSMDAGQRWLLTNSLGNPLRTWDERDHEFQYYYDDLHRPTKSKVLGGDGHSPLDHIFSKMVYGESQLTSARTDTNRFDEADLQAKNILGQPIKIYDTGGLIETPEYDFKGQPIATTRRLFKKYKEVANWTDANVETDLELDEFTFKTETDALGRITKQTAPDSSEITPSYNATGLLDGESVLHPDADTAVQYIKNIDFNEKGQRQKIIYGNNVSTKFYYDTETFRLKRLESKRKNGNVLQDLYYTYDPVGNITHIEDKNIPIQFFANRTIQPVSEYTYDPLYRLVKATGRENDAALNFGHCDNWNDTAFMKETNLNDPMALRNYTQSYHYDSVGNIKEMKHRATGGNWTRNYAYETGNNRLKTTSIGDNANPKDYTNYKHHEKHGYLEELPHLEKIGWNFKEEVVLTSRQRCSDEIIPVITYYQYDGEGQRLRKITENQGQTGEDPSKKEERIYIAGYETYRTFQAETINFERESLSLMDEGHRFVMVETVKSNTDPTPSPAERVGVRLARYQLHNHLGSAALELDNHAEVISYEEYHPFGTTAYQAKNKNIKSAAKRYRYTGMERDEETGLEYHSARYYLPWLGRWLSCDPEGLIDGTNLYCYAKGNTLSYTDPSGNQTLQMTENDKCLIPEIETQFESQRIEAEKLYRQMTYPSFNVDPGDGISMQDYMKRFVVLDQMSNLGTNIAVGIAVNQGASQKGIETAADVGGAAFDIVSSLAPPSGVVPSIAPSTKKNLGPPTTRKEQSAIIGRNAPKAKSVTFTVNASSSMSTTLKTPSLNRTTPPTYYTPPISNHIPKPSKQSMLKLTDSPAFKQPTPRSNDKEKHNNLFLIKQLQQNREPRQYTPHIYSK